VQSESIEVLKKTIRDKEILEQVIHVINFYENRKFTTVDSEIDIKAKLSKLHGLILVHLDQKDKLNVILAH
jgi:hypothetical protein